MSGITSTALPSFSHDQHHETDAANRKGGRPLAGTKLYCLVTEACVWTSCPGLQLTVGRPGFKPVTCWSQVQQLATEPHQVSEHSLLLISTNHTSIRHESFQSLVVTTKSRTTNWKHARNTQTTTKNTLPSSKNKSPWTAQTPVNQM